MLQPWLCGGAEFELSDSCVAFAVDAVTALLGSSGLKAECVAAVSDAVLEMAQYLLKNVAEYDWSNDKVGFTNTFIAIPCHIFLFHVSK